mgnify:CR=1|jgi:hypothetical protein|tara:strand:- start:81 stop:383 length:303 start_codon:yes stop_codon:yes gene_type:complete
MPSNLTLNSAVYLKLEKCIIGDGDRLLNKIETGRIDDCSLLNQTTLAIIHYLLQKVEPLPLECLIPCDVPYSNTMSSTTHGYLNKFINFANQHCDYCDYN